MSYRKITSFAIKDTMVDANPLKVVRGKEFDDEFDAITTAMDAQELIIANLVTTPVGGVIMYSAGVAPQGFLACDGAAQSRNTYAALFQAIGTTFGAGNGSTTFNVPNLSGRFPYGGAIGQVGGSADSTLPSHTHGATVAISDPGHSHPLTASVSSYGPRGGAGGEYWGAAPIATSTGGAATGLTATATIAAAGGSATNTNLPPFIGLAFIIKT